MKTTTAGTTTLALTLIVACLLALPVQAQDTTFMSIDDVRQGMKGVGRTVFQGTAIEEFGVEVLGVLKNFAPKQDMILVRLSGGPLEHTGVIAGMSGSPVYIDGKLLGAVAFAFPFSKDPIAGVQPISQMLNLLDQANPPVVAARASGSMLTESAASFVHRMQEAVSQGASDLLWLSQTSLPGTAAQAAPSLMRIQTPLLLSGVTPAAIQQFTPFFNALGFTPVQAGGGGSAPSVLAQANGRLEPGSSVNVEMIRGDVSFTANGTVTHIDGNKVYAFGHPNLGSGTTNLPMSAGYVISLLPNIQNSFKLAVPLNVVGAFRQDRSTGISGNIGDTAKMIPVKLKLTSSTSGVNDYNFEIANDRFLTPLLTNFAVFNAITASERGIGEMTLAVSGKIHLRNYEPVSIDSVFSGDANAPVMASVGTMAPIQYLMTAGYDDVDIESVDLEIVSTERKTNALLDSASVDRTEVRPGETLTLTVFLRNSAGDTFIERHPISIPSGLPAGPVQLLVGDGTTFTTTDLRRGPVGPTKDLAQAIRELNSLKKNNRLYVRIVNSEPGAVIGGEELPSLPPSMAAVIDTDRSSSRIVTRTGSSTVIEYELPQSNFVIQGRRSLNLTVMP